MLFNNSNQINTNDLLNLKNNLYIISIRCHKTELRKNSESYHDITKSPTL